MSWVHVNEVFRHEVSRQKTGTGGLFVCIKCGKTWEVSPKQFEFYSTSPRLVREGVVANFDIHGIYQESCEAAEVQE